MSNLDTNLCPFYKRTQIEYKMMEMTNYVGQYMLGADEYEVFDGSFFFWQKSADQLGVDLFLFVDATRNAKKERFKLLTYYQQTGAIHYSPAALEQLIKPAIEARVKNILHKEIGATHCVRVGRYNEFNQFFVLSSEFFWLKNELYGSLYPLGAIDYSTKTLIKPKAQVKLHSGYEWNEEYVRRKEGEFEISAISDFFDVSKPKSTNNKGRLL